MPELIVTYQKKKVFSVALSQPRFLIGRAQESDLILTGDSISRQHALITKKKGAFVLQDLSRFGLTVNGSQVKKIWELKHRDRIQIFDWTLEYVQRVQRKKHLNVLQDSQITLVQGEQKKEDTQVIAYHSEIDDVLNFRVELVIEDKNQKKKRVFLEKSKTLLGSHPECDVILEDDYTSARHAKFYFQDGQCVVKDLGSTNGVWSGGARVQEKILNHRDDLMLGKTKITVLFHPEKNQKLTFIGEEFCGMIGKSDVMQKLFLSLVKIASTNRAVLIEGESGTGKELVARAIHDLSDRKDRPFVAINCGALPENLIESELFGHEKGAFTGAQRQHGGAFEQASGGTLFLDEIAELDLSLQTRLLRVLESGSIRRVGAQTETPVDTRVVAATHQSLKRLVFEGKFREDLFYRLYVLLVKVPPLRQRFGDIEILAKIFLKNSKEGEAFEFEEAAFEKLKSYPWPGNVRELKNTVFRTTALCREQIIQAKDIQLLGLGFGYQKSILPQDEKEETRRIEEALKCFEGDKTKAAASLGIGRSTLFRRIKQLGI